MAAVRAVHPAVRRPGVWIATLAVLVGLPFALSPTASASVCPVGTNVSTSAQLVAALAAAKPGGVIVLAPGTYTGKLAIKVSGLPTAPIVLCGPSTAIIDGGTSSHALSLVKASWWQLTGFQIQHGNKGLDLSGSTNDVVTGLYIHNTSGAAVHANSFSTDNVFDQIVISHTGAEGFYIGSAQGNWCQYSGCKPDASDRNTIENSSISGTVSDPIDLKEGSSSGLVLDNTINGAGMTAKAWINVKGNSYTITGNVGTTSAHDGYDVHEILPGWGDNNVFSANSANVGGAGYGYYIQPGVTGNHVLCNNTAINAALGFSNIGCG